MIVSSGVSEMPIGEVVKGVAKIISPENGLGVDYQGWLDEMTGNLYEKSSMAEVLRPFPGMIRASMSASLGSVAEVNQPVAQLTGIMVAVEILKRSDEGDYEMSRDQQNSAAVVLNAACEIVLDSHPMLKGREDVKNAVEKFLFENGDKIDPKRNEELVGKSGGEEV